jgi:PAP2 superfamily
MDAHRTRTIRLLLVTAACALVAVPSAARADAVTDWNLQATNALIVNAGMTPPVAVIHLAMVHGAVYDAVNAIDRGYQPYLVAPPARRWYSKDAAAAAAAHRVLVNLVPAQQPTLDAAYAASLAAIAPGRARDGGVAVGEATAAAMLAARANDGRFGPFRFPLAVNPPPGDWRPTLPAFVNDPNAWVAKVTPFLIRDPADFRTAGPNPLTSRRYAREFNEVKSVGSATSTTRTPEQTDIAYFWSGHTLAIWSGIFRDLSAQNGLSTADDARYFAMLYLTGADAAISCWTDKAYWHFWRPITAIREADTDGNPATIADPNWLPLIPTPPYPDHPSGHACFSSSAVHTLQDFFGTDRDTFTVTSNAPSPPAPPGLTQTFTRFSQVIRQIIDARVWDGIHFRTADEQGARLGKEIARYRQKHYFHRAWRWHR